MTERTPQSRIQEFLDGELSSPEEKAFRKELERDEALRSEFAVWSALFSEIDGLPSVAPSHDLSDRVLMTVRQEKVPEPEAAGWRTRVVSWFRSASAIPVTSELLQDYLDGGLSTGLAGRVRSRIDADPALARESEALEHVFDALGSLPAHRPSAGFSEAVLSRVDLRARASAHAVAQAPATAVAPNRASWLERGWDRIRGLIPDRRQGMAAAAGVAVTPLVTFTALAYSIFTNPQLRPSQIAAYLSLKGSGATEAVGGWLYELAGSFGIVPALEFIQAQSSALPLVGLAFAVMSVVCLWILYRNVVASRPVDIRYVQLSL